MNLKNAHQTYEALLKVKGVKEFSKRPFFNEFALYLEKDAKSLESALKENKILGPLPLKDFYPEKAGAHLFAVTENRTASDCQRLLKAVSLS